MENKEFGILSMEIYIPKYYISQTDLETADGCVGKYTRGLGQENLGFCTSEEDINSLCLTVVDKLVKKNGIDLRKIGFLEVGTETLVDKSKSTKTVLMRLFETCGNYDVEGVDVKNACFGGTAALFHAVNWLESSSSQGRLALVVAADIALYGDKSARPTGGAGAVAILLGPNAPLIIEPGLRSVYMCHTYDFYKPNMNSEYPIVDGPLSIQCYREALEACYVSFRKKAASIGLLGFVTMKQNDASNSTSSIDYLCFHTPFCRLVEKAFGWLALNDVKSVNKSADPMPPHSRNVLCNGVEEIRSGLDPDLFHTLQQSLETISADSAVNSRQLDAICLKITSELFKQKVAPGLVFAKNVGNMYTASVFACLASLITNVPEAKLLGRRILMFSYGSGLASAMYSIHVHPGRNPKKVIDGDAIVNSLLEKRKQVDILEFESLLEERRIMQNSAPLELVHRPEGLFPGTFYLKYIDDRYRRHYEQV